MMQIIKTIVEVEVVYDATDTQLVEVELRAYGNCRKIDKRTISKNNYLERFMVDVKMESLTWKKDEFSTTVNKCVSQYIENNKKEIYQTLCNILIEKCQDKS